MSDEMESMRGETYKLSGKQQRFAELFARGDITAVQAAREAGYSCSERSAIQCKEHAGVMAEVERHRAQIAEKHELSESWIIERLKHEAQHAESDGARVSALNTLAKTRGMLLDKQQIQQVESFAEEIKAAQQARRGNVVKMGKKVG